MVGIGGLVLALVSCGGMAAVANADFPMVRVVGLMTLFLLVISLVAAVRGLVWFVQGLQAMSTARR